jgi:hemerythrin-like domain-containing protein
MHIPHARPHDGQGTNGTRLYRSQDTRQPPSNPGQFSHLIPPHIEKEENVRFPMAESMLGEGEWVEVRRLWKDALEASNEA